MTRKIRERIGSPPIPDYVQEYLDGLKSDGLLEFSEETERKAFAQIKLQIDNEKDGVIKDFMQDTLLYHCKERVPLLSLVYELYWDQWVSEQRELQEKVQPMELFIALESILAEECDPSGYAKNATSVRWPLQIPENHSGTKEVLHVDSDVPPAKFLNSYYKFGVHKYRVGHAIKKIVDHLEARYGLDFKELEHRRGSEKKA